MSVKTKSEDLFKKLNLKHPSPIAVQKFLRNLPYNKEAKRETQRSALSALRENEAHCLEATLIAAAILEYSGYPPLVLSMESQDDLDHVVFIFKEKTGWGAVGRSRMEGLHGRKPVFKSVKDLVESYFDPFIDQTGRITGYAVANLDDMKSPWRDSQRNVWSVVHYLVDLKHKKFHASEKRYKHWFDYFKRTNQSGVKQKTWW